MAISFASFITTAVVAGDLTAQCERTECHTWTSHLHWNLEICSIFFFSALFVCWCACVACGGCVESTLIKNLLSIYSNHISHGMARVHTQKHNGKWQHDRRHRTTCMISTFPDRVYRFIVAAPRKRKIQRIRIETGGKKIRAHLRVRPDKAKAKRKEEKNWRLSFE